MAEKITPQMSVADLLAQVPQTIPVFLRYGMACVGCSMAAFEALENLPKIYGVDQETFMAELIRAGQATETKTP